MTAGSLASHAAIALENARLHRIVERQALVDGLTGIANRRQCEDALTAEICARRAPRRAADARPRRPRRLQGRQRRPRARRRRRRPAGVRRGASGDRPRLRPRRPLGRRGVHAPPARHRRAPAAPSSPTACGRPSRSARSSAGTGQVVTVTCSFGVAQHRPETTSGSSSPPPTGPSTGPSGRARTGSRLDAARPELLVVSNRQSA